MDISLFTDPARLNELLALIATTDPEHEDGRFLFGYAVGSAHLPALRMMLCCGYWEPLVNPYTMPSRNEWAVRRLFLEADAGTPEQRQELLPAAFYAKQYDVVEQLLSAATWAQLHILLVDAIATSDRRAIMLCLRYEANVAKLEQYRCIRLFRIIRPAGLWEIWRMPANVLIRRQLFPPARMGGVGAGLARATTASLARYIMAGL